MSLQSRLKGWIGEAITNGISALALDGDIYKRLNNITLRLTDGSTTQIDHIIVSKFGIFVIETKDYNCWIFGEEHADQWTAVYKGGKKFQFQNPLRQNYRHICALAEFLDISKDTARGLFHSLINFGPDTEFKTADKLPSHVTGGYITYIKGKTAIVFTDQEVDGIVAAIREGRIPPGFLGRHAHREHMSSLHARHREATCPSCGKPLVPRTRKSDGGQFIGCSGFPSCRYIATERK